MMSALPVLQSNRKRLLFSIAAFVASSVLCVLFFGACALVLAGPHSSLLPGALQPVVLILCWAGVLVLPFAAAWLVWRRFSRQRNA